MKIGDNVVFNDYVFTDDNFVPYYNDYKDHTFKIVKFHYNDTHIELECVTGDVKVKGYVHPSDLRKC